MLVQQLPPSPAQRFRYLILRDYFPSEAAQQLRVSQGYRLDGVPGAALQGSDRSVPWAELLSGMLFNRLSLGKLGHESHI